MHVPVKLMVIISCLMLPACLSQQREQFLRYYDVEPQADLDISGIYKDPNGLLYELLTFNKAPLPKDSADKQIQTVITHTEQQHYLVECNDGLRVYAKDRIRLHERDGVLHTNSHFTGFVTVLLNDNAWSRTWIGRKPDSTLRLARHVGGTLFVVIIPVGGAAGWNHNMTVSAEP